MGFVANLRLRRKLLIAMLPLALMAMAAAIYSSFESNMIDTRYSALIDTQVKALRSVGEARAHTNRFGLFLFELADETDRDRRQVIDGQLAGVAGNYHTAMTAALKQSPERAAALAGNNVKASNILRGGLNQELQRSRQATIEIMQDLQAYIDQRCDQLTNNTH